MSVINTNSSALRAQNNLSISGREASKAIERLSSGLRINSARDDAAGQAIANRMTSNIRGMNQAVRNANDGISLLQTQESGLNEINTNLQRMRELSVQAANGTNSASDLTSIQAEFAERRDEITRIAGKSEFNNNQLLNVGAAGGAGGTINIQVGADAGDTISIKTINATAAGLSVDALDVTADAGAAITALDTAISTVDTARSDIGAKLNRLESTINVLSNTALNQMDARSRIQDADYAAEVSNMSRANILQQAGTSVLAQANQSTQNVLSLLR